MDCVVLIQKRLHGITSDTIRKPHSLSGNNIQSKAIYFDAKGNLWVGTWNNGLNFIAKDELYKEKPKVKHWKTSEEKKKGSFSNNNVLAIHEDKKELCGWGHTEAD